jgi:hypothetical protein
VAIVNTVKEVLHRIRVRLYPNYFQNAEGAYIAKTVNEATLNVEQVCASLKNRGGFTGNYENLVEHVRQFYDEAAYQLCNGFSVNTGYYTIHPNIGGTFDSENEIHDRKKHPVSFIFRAGKRLRLLAENIAVVIEGIADCTGWIDEFIDIDENSVNTLYAPGSQFIIHGHKIKVQGDDPACGVYFVPIDDPSQEARVTRIAVNTPTRIVGIAPQTRHARNRIEIRTQFTGSGSTSLKAARAITSSFIVEEA